MSRDAFQALVVKWRREAKGIVLARQSARPSERVSALRKCADELEKALRNDSGSNASLDSGPERV